MPASYANFLIINGAVLVPTFITYTRRRRFSIELGEPIEVDLVIENGRGEIVAARLDQDQIEIGKAFIHRGNGCQIDRAVLANRRVRTTARLHASDTLAR
mgnify:CR=1 FL=1